MMFREIMKPIYIQKENKEYSDTQTWSQSKWSVIRGPWNVRITWFKHILFQSYNDYTNRHDIYKKDRIRTETYFIF